VSDQFNWDTLRTGPLSPSMLQGPAHRDEYYHTKTSTTSKLGPTNAYSMRNSYSDPSAMQYHIQTPQQMIKKEKSQPDVFIHSHYDRSSTSPTDDEDGSPIKKRRYPKRTTVDSEEEEEEENGRKKNRPAENDEKRKNFLERNRIAALKCRQRKKQWLNGLQNRVEFLTGDNLRLQTQLESLKEEIVNLKTLLLAHKECPVAQANGFHPNAIQKSMPPRHPSYSMPNSSRNNSTSSSSQFQRATIVNRQVQSPNQQGMMAGGGGGGSGGGSSMMRF